MDEGEKKLVEQDIKNGNIASKYYRLLYQEFNIKEHYKIVDSHRQFVMKAYNRLRKFVPNISETQAQNHDLSKYDLVQAIGYTVRWVHLIDNDTWRAALDNHYKREPHHPQFFGKGRMTEKYLEESLIDMVACRWERMLEGDENVKDFDLVDFNPVYLNRYNNDDLKYILATIRCIKSDSF